jgi:hypothetical protein
MLFSEMWRHLVWKKITEILEENTLVAGYFSCSWTLKKESVPNFKTWAHFTQNTQRHISRWSHNSGNIQSHVLKDISWPAE